jgi:hypothetical protein
MIERNGLEWTEHRNSRGEPSFSAKSAFKVDKLPLVYVIYTNTGASLRGKWKLVSREKIPFVYGLFASIDEAMDYASRLEGSSQGAHR